MNNKEEKKSLKRPTILVFCRDYLIPDFQENLTPLDNEFDFFYLTDGTTSKAETTKNRFYKRLGTTERPKGFTEDDELDVIERCRYLRNLPLTQSKKILRAMASVLEEELDLQNPQIIVGQLVDEYITHLLSKIAYVRNIKYIGLCYSYFSGKALITQFSNGQAYNNRIPSNEEINHAISEISQQSFRRDYSQKNTYTPFKHSLAVARYYLKVVAFKVLKWKNNDPLSLHYNCLPFVAERRKLSDLPPPNLFHENWNGILAGHKINNKKIIYFPLSYYPESTTNYWIDNKRILKYQETILEICKHLSKDYILIVKEHLHMLGARNPSFYQQIKNIDGIISIPPQVFSNEILDITDGVLIGSGSIGVESFMRDKPIVTYCKSSYWFPISKSTFVDLSTPGQWGKAIEHSLSKHKKTTQSEKEHFIKQCLCSTIRVKKSGQKWPICNTKDLSHLLNNIINQEFTNE